MTEPRTSQDLLNKIADIIDFSPHKYNQGVWGQAGTQYIGIDDPTYIMWDDTTWEHENIHITLDDLKEVNRVDDACGTQACVAGWACLLSGYHPTMVETKVEEEDDSWAGSILNRVSSVFTSKGGLFNIFSKKVGFNYNVMCDNVNIDTPINPDTGRLLQMEDIADVGIGIGGRMFYRPDSLGRVLLDLDGEESRILFDGDYAWEANDLRLIGKGEDIGKLLSENFVDEWCHECDNSVEECEC